MPIDEEDLFDIEKRPGAGIELWRHAVEHQLERTRAARHEHCLAHSTNPEEKIEDTGSEWRLHMETYFLALAVRRVVLFCDLLARHAEDERLLAARRRFDERHPDVRRLRNMYEHVGEYLLDSPRKHERFEGRAWPLISVSWRQDNVVVEYGPYEVDVTLAAVGAVELAGVGEAVWDGELLASKARTERRLSSPPPEEDDGVLRTMVLTASVSTIISGPHPDPEVRTGVLTGYDVRLATPEEIAARDDDRSLP